MLTCEICYRHNVQARIDEIWMCGECTAEYVQLKMLSVDVEAD